MASFYIRNHISILIHILLLIGLALYLLQPLSWSIELPKEFWIRQGILFILWITLFFINSRILVPKYLFGNKTGLFILLLFSSIIAVLILVRVAEFSLGFDKVLQNVFHHKSKGGVTAGIRIVDMFTLFTTVMVAGISTSISTVQKWHRDAQLRLSLEQEKIRSELAFLKAQINPHFFFNTLHNIYALTMTRVEKAGEAIYTLSHMMRYVLYDTQNDDTLLSKEVIFIEDYLQLMQLRLTDKVKVTFEKPSGYEEKKIAPMLILPFVENAFKHGISATEQSHISIKISTTDDEVFIEVRNSLFPEKTDILEESNGIGLTNTKRRLDLLYPEKYQLIIKDKTEENEFLVQLKIQNK